jgi:hypothetical protein
MSRPTARALFLPAICLLAAFGLVACGGDSNNDSSSSATTSSSDTSSTASVPSGATASTPAGATAPTTTSTDALAELFFQTVRQQIEKQGLSPEVASCVEQQLRQTITPAEIDQLKTGKQPPALRQKATDAGAKCAQAALSGK